MRLHTFPDPILLAAVAPFPVEQLTDPASSESWRRLFDEAAVTCAREHGYAIAAPQVGSSLSWFLVLAHRDLGTTRPTVYINPSVITTGDQRAVVVEGCLSLPGLRVPVSRPTSLSLLWTDEAGVERTQVGISGLLARVIFHELDHLRGVLNVDRTDSVQRKRAEHALQAMRQGR